MNRLMQQLINDDQDRERASRIRMDQTKRKIAYRVRNGMIFVIDTRSVEDGDEPIVWTTEADLRGASHQNHTYNNGRIDFPRNLHGLELAAILDLIDHWAAGYEAFLQIGHFGHQQVRGEKNHGFPKDVC